MTGGQKKIINHSSFLNLEPATAAIASAAIPAINPNPGNASLTAPKPPSSSSSTIGIVLIDNRETQLIPVSLPGWLMHSTC